MRVANNIFAFGNNYSNFNYKRNENKTYISTTIDYDTVTFTGRRPKDFVNAVGQAKKAVAKATKGTGKRHIKNVMHAQLNPETQKQVENIHKNLTIITEFFKRLKTNPPRAEKIKSDYINLVTGTKKQGFTFTMEPPFGKNIMTISRGKNEPNLLRLVVETPDKQETHVLLDGFDKVVGNLNKKNPRFMPPKFRYMTTEELNAGYTKAYIQMANSQLENFAQYLERVSTEAPIKTRKPNVPTTTTKLVTELSPALSREQSISKLFELFEKGADEIPAHINPQISQSSQKVVVFSLKTEDGGTLRVSKRMNPLYGSQLRYVTLEKTSPEGYKHFISIDFETKEFLKCDTTNGKPKIVNDSIFSYTPAEIKEYNIEHKFNDYMKEIFRASKETDTPHEVTVLKTKDNTQIKRKIEDMDVSEFEDARITAEVAKEQKLAGSKIQKPVIEPENRPVEVKPEQPIEEVKPVKKRGRKPKVKTETPAEQPKAQQPSDGIEKFKTDMLAKATDEANNFAEEYFKTFITQFKKAMSEKMSDFQSKLDELFKN